MLSLFKIMFLYFVYFHTIRTENLFFASIVDLDGFMYVFSRFYQDVFPT